MKVKRHKKVQKHMGFYTNNFGFRQPYQILIDGTFCFTALKNKINIKDQLPKYMQAELKLLTTQCVIMETEHLGSKVHGALIIVKQFHVHKCGHEGKPITGSACLISMVKKLNANRYIIATQDRDLQEKLRKMPVVPIIYLHQIAPILEQPSDITMQLAKNQIDNRFGVSKTQENTLDKLKKESGIETAKEDSKPKKKKKKGPNPLSCKKKKSKPQVASVQGGGVGAKKKDVLENKRKVKKKLRIPKHVLEELAKKPVS